MSESRSQKAASSKAPLDELKKRLDKYEEHLTLEEKKFFEGKKRVGGREGLELLAHKQAVVRAMLADVNAVLNLSRFALDLPRQLNIDEGEDGPASQLANELVNSYAESFLNTEEEDANPSALPIVCARNRLVADFEEDLKILDGHAQDVIYNTWQAMSKSPQQALSQIIQIRRQLALLGDMAALAQRPVAQRLTEQLITQHNKSYQMIVAQVPQPTMATFKRTGKRAKRVLTSWATDQVNIAQDSDAVECILALERTSNTIGRQFINIANIADAQRSVQANQQVLKKLPSTDRELLNVLSKHRGNNPLIWFIDKVRHVFGYPPLKWSTGYHDIVRPLQIRRHGLFHKHSSAQKGEHVQEISTKAVRDDEGQQAAGAARRAEREQKREDIRNKHR